MDETSDHDLSYTQALEESRPRREAFVVHVNDQIQALVAELHLPELVAYFNGTIVPLVKRLYRMAVLAGLIEPPVTRRQALRAARTRAHRYMQRRERRR